ncbi:PREDICTED: TMV resistance protein N-like [Tarenaya hassleriana]|uniref:TMV resistance protein N-like n=1 Tax=Tarenaya hassleriana TaxID=28532 RepID=UPI00053C4B97|nr:PREDICTED: TMV resistance protein N-like [Tarenaya hassleriana]
MPSSSSSSSLSSSSSSSSSAIQIIDVFLSFRGPDTRRKFISFLYRELDRKGIRAFKDDTEVERGRLISPELIQAIRSSKFAVVVVSENYAASSWCLEELVKILEFQKTGSLTVIPIFYDIEPSDLRRRKGKVAEQFQKHESREDPQKVDSWKKAVTKLADIRGECSLKWDDDSKLVDGITERIAKELYPAASSISRNLVGFEDHMKALYQLLDLNSNKDTRLIGIWCMGCNGRSTLARCLYKEISKHFQTHCLLENVKGICSQLRSPSRLRKEFISRLHGEEASLIKSMNMGTNAINARLRNQKTLLVADDVDKIEQIDSLAEVFNSFGPGSRVIITTQDKQLLASCGVNLVYEVELLRCCEVRQLFRQVAFRRNDIPVGMEPSSYWAMKLTLAMKSYASSLCCRGQLRGSAESHC